MVITNVNQVVYNGNGSTASWPFTFRIIEASDIQLILVGTTGAETKLTQDYYVDTANSTVYYPGYAPGSEPPLAQQPPKVQTGEKLIIYRSLPDTQTSELGDKWPFDVIENALDKLTMLIQDLKDIAARSLKVRVSDTNNGFDTTITPVPRQAIQINASGTGFECVESPSQVLAQCQTIYNQTVEKKNEAAESANAAAGSATSAQTYAGNANNSAEAALLHKGAAAEAATAAAASLASAELDLEAVRAYITASTVNAFWDSATEYEVGDCVLTSDGTSYRCIQDSTNNPPATSPAYWSPVTVVEPKTFEYDENGDIMPCANPVASALWDIDENGDIMPAAM